MSWSPSFRAQLVMQTAIGVAAVLGVAMTPPARGRMMIVSLGGQTAGEIAAWAVRGDVRMIAGGPLNSTLIVEASTRDLLGQALRHGGILVAAPTAGCWWGGAA